jgi:hypothetical protein
MSKVQAVVASQYAVGFNYYGDEDDWVISATGAALPVQALLIAAVACYSYPTLQLQRLILTLRCKHFLIAALRLPALRCSTTVQPDCNAWLQACGHRRLGPGL